MALEGLSVVLLPERLVKAEIDAIELHRVGLEWLPEPWSYYARYASVGTALYVEKAAQFAQDAAWYLWRIKEFYWHKKFNRFDCLKILGHLFG